MSGVGSRPLIGLSARRWPSAALGGAFPPAYDDAAMDVGVADYATAVAGAGGVPVHLCADTQPDAVADHLDGLVLTGGADVHPAAHGWQLPHPVAAVAGTEPGRDRWELHLLRVALDRGLPVLAICRGLQLLNVALGGTLVADLPAGVGDDHPRFDRHRSRPAHDVWLEDGSLAAAVYGPRVRVNSLHHQAVDRPGADLRVTGRSPDGTVEALELPGARILAVQWHPESLADDPGPAWLVAQALAAV